MAEINFVKTCRMIGCNKAAIATLRGQALTRVSIVHVCEEHLAVLAPIYNRPAEFITIKINIGPVYDSIEGGELKQLFAAVQETAEVPNG